MQDGENACGIFIRKDGGKKWERNRDSCGIGQLKISLNRKVV